MRHVHKSITGQTDQTFPTAQIRRLHAFTSGDTEAILLLAINKEDRSLAMGSRNASRRCWTKTKRTEAKWKRALK